MNTDPTVASVKARHICCLDYIIYIQVWFQIISVSCNAITDLFIPDSSFKFNN